MGQNVFQGGSTFSGSISTLGTVIQGNFINLDCKSQDDCCLADLRLPIPHDDKKRIEDTNGGLLAGSYRWILENPEFQQWRHDTQSRLLWIKGDPGKGKTMLLCGILTK
ncbi:hypothetical protein BJ875DRAFT_501101 [Amylocarpus encephaloides]|uniref:Nephrocystin 3-like N-terminal domain-containing protein n=1 Tax=Amylocarpus encephaloides TaxID=45428 RepID=A0A9P7Y612_9HELO|nr:hypothetical protein BJ875DRAFT_501101 [Amylocarpus encephaloides]